MTDVIFYLVCAGAMTLGWWKILGIVKKERDKYRTRWQEALTLLRDDQVLLESNQRIFDDLLLEGALQDICGPDEDITDLVAKIQRERTSVIEQERKVFYSRMDADAQRRAMNRVVTQQLYRYDRPQYGGEHGAVVYYEGNTSPFPSG